MEGGNRQGRRQRRAVSRTGHHAGCVGLRARARRGGRAHARQILRVAPSQRRRRLLRKTVAPTSRPPMSASFLKRTARRTTVLPPVDLARGMVREAATEVALGLGQREGGCETCPWPTLARRQPAPSPPAQAGGANPLHPTSRSWGIRQKPHSPTPNLSQVVEPPADPGGVFKACTCSL